MTTTTAAVVDWPTKCPDCDWAPPAPRSLTVSWLSVAKHLRAAHNDWPAVKSAHRAAHAAARSTPSR